MRPPSYGAGPSVTMVLIAINTGIFVLVSVLEFWAPAAFRAIRTYCALSVPGVSQGYIWQFVTFQFLHAGLLHLVCNLITIYFFGRELENVLGRVAYLKLYLLSGIAGGLLQFIFGVIAPEYFGGMVVGASAGAFGLVAAYATMFPDQILTVLVMFILPVSLRARTLLWVSSAIVVFGIIVPNDSLADAAHLGGILAGVAFVQFGGTQWLNWTPSWSWLRSRRVRTPVAPLTRGRREAASVWPEESMSGSHEFISREVDPILDKISAHGIHSLTERERQILEMARNRMAKR